MRPAAAPVSPRHAAALAVLAALAGCFDATPADGTVLCSGDAARPCPRGYDCFAGACYRHGGSDGGHGGDAGDPCAACPGPCGTQVAGGVNGWRDWRANGQAVFSDGDGVLTTPLPPPDGGVAPGSAGTIVFRDAIDVDAFELSFAFKLGDGAMSGDGLAFMLESDGAAAVGASGSGLGVGGLHGYGVELDTYKNVDCASRLGDDKEPSANHVGVDRLTLAACGGSGAMPTPLIAFNDIGLALADGSWHTCIIHFVNGAFDIHFDESARHLSYTLPSPWTPAPYYFGFGAGSGFAQADQRIHGVVLKLPTPRCL